MRCDSDPADCMSSTSQTGAAHATMQDQEAVFDAIQIPPARFKRPHRKSRNGCLRCKQRRIKCDEQRPSCAACTVRSNVCSYPPRQPLSASAPQGLQITYALGECADEDDVQDQPQASSSSPTDRSEADPNASDKPFELELTQCYFSQVAQTFMGSNSRTEQHWIWHVFVPSLAYNSQTVRYGMLTMAAIYKHFAINTQDAPHHTSTYVDAANFYGNQFVEQSRQQLSRLDPSETDSNVACSRLLGALSLAFHREYRTCGLRIDDPAAWKWVHLLRGVKTVHVNIIASGQALDPMLQLDMAPNWPLSCNVTSLNSSSQSMGKNTLLAYIWRTQAERFTALRQLIHHDQTQLGEEQRAFCFAAIDALAVITSQVCEMQGISVFRVLGAWIGKLSPDTVSLLEYGHHAVLAIDAHWLMMLILCEDLWFIDDMGRAGILNVLEATSSSPEVLHVLQWPQGALNISRAENN